MNLAYHFTLSRQTGVLPRKMAQKVAKFTHEMRF